MKRQILMVALLSGLVMAAGAASAEEHRGERPDFATLDLNGDGALSLEELQAQGDARFADADANGDGGLSAEELFAAAESRGADRAARMIERFEPCAAIRRIEENEVRPLARDFRLRLLQGGTGGHGKLCGLHLDHHNNAIGRHTIDDQNPCSHPLQPV